VSAEPASGRPYGAAGDGLLRIALPPGTPAEARTTVQRLVEVTGMLSRRCAQLQQALESRVAIEQAKGIVAARLDVSVDDAFELMRQTARNERTKVRELADEIVASRTVPPRIARLRLEMATETNVVA